MNFDSTIKLLFEQLSSLKLYHATDKQFNAFDSRYASGQMGIHLGTLPQAMKVYAELLADGKKPRVLEVEVRIENPLRLEDQGGWQGYEVTQMVYEALGKKFIGQNLNSDRLRNLIAQAGYDSVVYKNEFEGSGDSYIVFDDKQINILRVLNKKEIETNRLNESVLLEYSFNVAWDSYMLKNKYDLAKYGSEEEIEKAKIILRNHLIQNKQKHLLDEMDWSLTSVNPGNVGEVVYSFNYMSSKGDTFYNREFDHETYTKIRFGKKFKASKKSIDAVISDPSLAYRGMSMSEYTNAKKNNYFKSNSAYNLGDAQQGYTFFGSDYETGRFYATAFTTTPTTKNRPHVIIAINKKYLQNAKELNVGNANEWVAKDKIPFKYVEKIWVLAPIEDFGGSMEIVYNEQTGKTRVGSSAAPMMNYQLVEIR